MYPSCQPQIVWGNQQYSTHGSSTRSDGNLWGSNVRRIMGIMQIVCGTSGFALGVVDICLETGGNDVFGWGLWNGMFSTITGFLGIYSKKKKGMVISYMVTSIIASILGVACLFYSAFGLAHAVDYYYRYYGILALYIIMCIVYLVQIVVSIIGASFTCGAVSSNTNQSHQIVYYYTSPVQTQQYGPPTQNEMTAGQPFNPPQYTPSFQSPTPNNQPQQYDPAPSGPLSTAK